MRKIFLIGFILTFVFMCAQRATLLDVKKVGEELFSQKTFNEQNRPFNHQETSLNAQASSRTEGEKRKKADRKRIIGKEFASVEGGVEYFFEPFAKGGFAFLSLPSFYKGAFHDVKNALHLIENEGDLYGIVLDVRINEGGLFEEALKIVTLFTKKIAFPVEEFHEKMPQVAGNIFLQKLYRQPLIILTSKKTKHLAELLAAILQEEGRCLVVGDEKTVGLSNLQNEILLQKQRDVHRIAIENLFSKRGCLLASKKMKVNIVIPTCYQNAFKATSLPLYVQTKKEGEIGSFLNFLSNTHIAQMLPSLLQNSSKRLAEDKNFQAFLRKERGESATEEEPFLLSHGTQDLSLKEASNILKDIAFFSTH